ncbi:MAG: hypothetical protein ACLFVJ_07325 [Persicimonas sp.]
MATDQNTIPSQVVEDLLEGLTREPGSLTDMMCERVPVDGIKGAIPVEPSSSSLTRESTHGLIPEGAVAKPIDEELDDVAYSCGRATGFAVIPDGTADQVDSVTGTSTVQRLLKKCLDQVHRDMDGELSDVLDSATLNETFDADSDGGGEWDDDASTPLKDFDDALDLVPGSELAYVGRTDSKNLKIHPDVVAEISNFSAGSASAGQLASLLQNKFGFSKVIVGNVFYSNAANEGQSLSVEYDLEDITWIGRSRDLILVEKGSIVTEQGRILERQADALIQTRRVDILRPHKEMGLKFTTTTT